MVADGGLPVVRTLGTGTTGVASLVGDVSTVIDPIDAIELKPESPARASHSVIATILTRLRKIHNALAMNTK